MDWRVVELLGYAYYVERGYRVFVPVVHNDGYDFIAEKDGQFVRVNVKMAGLKDKSNPTSWCVSQASGSVVNASCRVKTRCDVLLTYLPQLEKFIELPGNFFDSSHSKSRRIPKEFLFS